MKSARKVVCLILSLLSVTMLIMSCNGTGTTDGNSTTATESMTDTTTEPTETTVSGEPLEIPENSNYDGYIFTFLNGNPAGIDNPLAIEEENGEVLNDTMFNAVRNVSERLNVDFATNNDTSLTDISKYRAIVLAGEDSIDIARFIDRFAMSAALEGLCTPYTEIDTIHLEKPWWYNTYNDALSMRDVNFHCLSYFSILQRYINVIAFNKNHFDDYGWEYPYEQVRNGTWTIDAMYGYMTEFGGDVNGDNKMDSNDLWGVSYVNDQWYSGFAPASGQFIVSKDNNGEFIFNVPGNEKIISIWEKVMGYEDSVNVYNMHLMKGYKQYDSSDYGGGALACFADGNSLFVGTLLNSLERLRGMEDDYGLLPFPRYEESEPGTLYTAYTPCAGPTIVISASLSNPERTGVIYETLAYEFYNNVSPVYLDTIVTIKNVRDEESAKLLEIMTDNVYPDLAIGYWGFGGILYDVFQSKKNTFVSSFDKFTSKINAAFETTSEYFDKIK